MLEMQHKNPLNRVQKRCRVCGDQAIGFNFNGLSCNSCKVFFRRVVFKQDLKCEKFMSCEINKISRKLCTKCRYDKCLELVLSRGNKINCPTLETVVQSIDRISLLSNEHTLNHKIYEQSRLQEIYSAALAFPDENSCQIIGQVETVSQMVNLPANNIKHVIRFCKRMSPFNCLTKDDQVLVLKSFMLAKSLMRIAFLYNTETNGWTAIAQPNCDKNVVFAKMEFMKSCLDESLFKNFHYVVINMHREMENDCAILDLILAQLLFKHRQNIHKTEFVRYHNLVFHYLLRRNLEHKYLDMNRTTQKYTALMSLLCQMDVFNVGFTMELKQQFHSEAPISIQFAPVIKEIFNLSKN